MTMHELIGKILNHYQITSLLEEGGIGYIYKGTDNRSQREVVIRIIPESLAQRPGFERSFLLAARTASRLDHPGIGKVFDFGKHENYLYLVMEFITGETLAQKLDKAKTEHKNLPQSEVVQITRQILLALDYACKQGIVHIDIHPSKIILTPPVSQNLSSHPVISDLGLAWLASGENLSQEGKLYRSPAYLSPEQARGAPSDIRSDVFTVGVLLYEMATAKLPFPIRTIAEAVEYHQNEQVPSPRLLRPSLSPELDKVILKSLQKDPDKRFSDMASLEKALMRSDDRMAENSPARVKSTLPPQKGSQLPESGKEELIRPQGDYVIVQTKDRPAYSIPITKGEMSIGRGKAADIPLNSLGVSRNHAKLIFDDRDYYLIDLDSTNGTFLDEGKLLPGVPDLWNPSKVARIGPFILQLVRVGKFAPIPPNDRRISQIFLRDGSQAEPKHVHISPGEGRIGVVLEEDDLVVQAGESAGLTIVLSNQGQTVDHFRVIIEGVPASWITVQPQSIHLMPEHQGEHQGSVLATFKPPKATTSKAGIYDLIIRVSSTQAPDQRVEVIATLTVLPFVEYTSELHPQKIDVNQKARLTIRNQGNNLETFAIRLKDQADKLKFIPPQAQVQIPEGQTGVIEFSASTRQLHLMRKPVSHAYSAELSASSGGEKRTYTGEVVSNGLIPVWLPPLFMLLCLGLAAAVPLAYRFITKTTPTPTAVPVPSGTSIPTPAISVVLGTPTAVSGTPEPNFTPTPTPFCPGAPKSQGFKKGDIVKISNDIAPDETLAVHSSPVFSDSTIIGRLAIGAELEINNSKPECVISEKTGAGVIMWNIQLVDRKNKFADGSTRGWVVEGEQEYYIVPGG